MIQSSHTSSPPLLLEQATSNSRISCRIGHLLVEPLQRSCPCTVPLILLEGKEKHLKTAPRHKDFLRPAWKSLQKISSQWCNGSHKLSPPPPKTSQNRSLAVASFHAEKHMSWYPARILRTASLLFTTRRVIGIFDTPWKIRWCYSHRGVATYISQQKKVTQLQLRITAESSLSYMKIYKITLW